LFYLILTSQDYMKVNVWLSHLFVNNIIQRNILIGYERNIYSFMASIEMLVSRRTAMLQMTT